ncbi:MAG: phage tail protein [Planctomycetota bacterium]|jgi:microcystin-dependent protein
MSFTPFPATTPASTITGQPEKVAPIGADELIIADSEDSASSKKIQISNLPSAGGTEIGSVTTYAGASIPTGYLSCDGSAISRTTYADLFTALGVAHGEGDGSTTFNLPDLRGRFIRMVDGGAGNDPDSGSRTAAATGGNTGDAVGSLQADEIDSHAHTTQMQNAVANSNTPAQSNSIAVATDLGQKIFHQSNPNASISIINNFGGNETRPKNINMNYIIKY